MSSGFDEALEQVESDRRQSAEQAALDGRLQAQINETDLRSDGTDPIAILGNDAGIVIGFIERMRTVGLPGARLLPAGERVERVPRSTLSGRTSLLGLLGATEEQSFPISRPAYLLGVLVGRSTQGMSSAKIWYDRHLGVKEGESIWNEHKLGEGKLRSISIPYNQKTAPNGGELLYICDDNKLRIGSGLNVPSRLIDEPNFVSGGFVMLATSVDGDSRQGGYFYNTFFCEVSLERLLPTIYLENTQKS